jgi:hypothetical protein
MSIKAFTCQAMHASRLLVRLSPRRQRRWAVRGRRQRSFAPANTVWLSAPEISMEAEGGLCMGSCHLDHNVKTPLLRLLTI